VKLEDVVKQAECLLITGRRGSGKTALGYRCLEILKDEKPAYVLGVPEHIWKYLPDDIVPLPLDEQTMLDLPDDAAFFFDEAALHFYSRDSHRYMNKLIGSLITLSRQRGWTVIFATHNTRKLDVGILIDVDAILFKEPSPLHAEMERVEIRKLMQRVYEAFSRIPKNERVKYAYVFSDIGRTLVETPLPSFWRQELSTPFRSPHDDAKSFYYECQNRLCGLAVMESDAKRNNYTCPKCGSRFRKVPFARK